MRFSQVWLASTALLGSSLASNAQTLDPAFSPFYQITLEGAVPGVPPNYGGLTFSQDDSNVILIGGAANALIADIFAIRISRDANRHMIGFDCGGAAFHADAAASPYGGIDGGLAYGPGGVLFFTAYAGNGLGQIRPGSTTPDRWIALTDLGVWPSTGAVQFVPDGFPGAGKMKILSFNGSVWYSFVVTPDGLGTYNVTADSPAVAITIGGGPEGTVYIEAGNPGFSADSVLVSEWGTGRVVAYEVDANGDPIVSTQRVFISGLSGAEGAAIDPVTGDFLFSTFGGGNQIVRVSGFTTIVPCEGNINLDGRVDLADLSIMLANFGQTGIGDLNGDCTTNLTDLSILLANFGTVCP